MLVPRSFKYSSSPPLLDNTRPNDQPSRSKRITFTKSSFVATGTNSPSEPPAILIPAMPAIPEPSKPVEIPSRRSTGEFKNVPSTKVRSHHGPRKSRNVEKGHRPDTLPPAVAALLALTAIPPPKKVQPRRRKTSSRQMSIDELVQEWRNDTSIKPTLSSASLDMLLQTTDDDGYQSRDEHMYSSRSTSCDSIPSLEGDDGSLLSVSNSTPATPGSIRSRKSSHASYRKEKTLLTPESEDCGVDHPLGFDALDLDDRIFISPSPSQRNQNKRKSTSLKSNLSSSLQAFKSRVSSSFSSLNLNLNVDDASFSDASLWQHPYLFPRFSPELRPTPFTSPPSISQRRYLNPPPLPVSFEEQQHHWQQALSGHSFVSPDDDFSEAPMIQMQTYKRGKSTPTRRSRRNSSSGPDPRSEAGRAMSGHVPVPTRQREPRENSNFLRVVVLEMNMRRGGKLDDSASGRARIWLPPRKPIVARDNSVFSDEDEDDFHAPASGPRLAAKKIPQRWVGVSIE